MTVNFFTLETFGSGVGAGQHSKTKGIFLLPFLLNATNFYKFSTKEIPGTISINVYFDQRKSPCKKLKQNRAIILI